MKDDFDAFLCSKLCINVNLAAGMQFQNVTKVHNGYVL